ncbi:MAG: diacylglycerol O-acyltransferase / wax synthase [Mycobacterium sp.]|nr:diacylglycerol O-acyltransferase / wax synthase [Mycobacterium sp.]
MKRLGGWDATFIYSDTANVPTHTMKIVLVDTSTLGEKFTFDAFRRVVANRLPALDPLRYQLVDIPLKIHHPMWLEDCDVDIDYHVRRAVLPHPGGRRELDDLIGEIARAPLDHSRPLWEMYFVDGVVDNRVAIVTKVHHALADGVAAANLLARAVDLTWNPQAEPTSSSAAPSSTELLRAAGRDHLTQLKRLPKVVGDTVSGVRRLRRRTRDQLKPNEFPSQQSPPRTFLNHVVDPGRRFATATMSLAEVKQTSKHFGVTINDVVLAIASGALRELLARRDGRSDQPLIASVAFNTDPSPERISGNALAGLFVTLPVNIADPLQRLRLVSMAARDAKETNAVMGPDLLGRWINYLPPPVAPGAYRWLANRDRNRLYNLSFSNVAGPRQPGHIGSAPISELYSVGPLQPGCGMNVTVWSYVDQLNVAVLTDHQTLDDAHQATDALLREFAEIWAATGFPGQPTPVSTALAQASVLI